MKLMIRNAGADSTRPEILVYGSIGDDWSDDCITAKQFADALSKIGAVAEIGVRINSFGGSVADGFAMYNSAKNHSARIIVDVDGFCISAASTVAMAGDEIRMHENSAMMIHRPQTLAFGDADDFRKQADILDMLQAQIAGVYAARAGRPVAEFDALMAAETWFTAQEAFDIGLATAVIPNAGNDSPPNENPDEDPAMLNRFRRVPGWVKQKANQRAGQNSGGWLATLRRRRLELHEKAGK